MRLLATLLIAFAPAAAWAQESVQPKQEIAQPQYASGDTWIYHVITQNAGAPKETDMEYSVIRQDGDDLLAGIKPVGSVRPPRQRMFHSDWSQFRGVDGVETIVLRPLAFPLTLEKAWKVSYTETNPGPGHLSDAIEQPWKVIGWEDVTTPAGKFRALKIEARGNWVADIAQKEQTNSPATADKGAQHLVQGERRVQGRNYHAVWYVPEVKRWVRSIDDSFLSNGDVASHVEMNLTAYNLASAPPGPEMTPAKP